MCSILTSSKVSTLSPLSHDHGKGSGWHICAQGWDPTGPQQAVRGHLTGFTLCRAQAVVSRRWVLIYFTQEWKTPRSLDRKNWGKDHLLQWNLTTSIHQLCTGLVSRFFREDSIAPGILCVQRLQEPPPMPTHAMPTTTYNNYEPFFAPPPPHTAVAHSLPTLPPLFTHHNMTIHCLRPT